MSKKQQAEPVSVNIFDLIDSICAEFRKQWKAGKRPKMEGFLGQAPENAREALLRNLLLIDIRYRERSGEKPSPDEYMRRFPQFKRVVGDAFHFSTSMSMEAMRGTPPDDSQDLPATIEGPAANGIGDYELIRELGRGGFGVVYEAKHTKRQNRVALKTLPTGQDGQQINAERLHKFRREFRSLSEFNHPNLVGMQTLEVDGGQWFLTMDLIDGIDFLSYVRPGGKLDENRLRESLWQLASGIIALHEKRILHRDLKPSNVLVSKDGRVSILDFGLVAELEQATDETASMQTRNFAGTPRYAAPEQVFGERSSATDWYALGTMLFEALTGEPPFSGTASELLIRKQNEDPPQLIGQDYLPADLTALTNELLQREPKQRPDANAITQALKLEVESVSHGSHDSRDAGDEEAQTTGESALILIGREKQMGQLEGAKQKLLEQRRPVVVWITGLSGEGKSSLAEKFLAPLRRGKQVLVLSGRCYDRESVPFKAIDSIIEPLVVYLSSRHGRWLESQLPEDISFLAQLFPLLRRVDAIAGRGIANMGRMEPEKIRARGFYALRELLVAISTRTPVVILIDDLQWADADSGQAWVDLLTGSQAPSILFLGSYRSDEADESSFLQTWNRLTAQEQRRIESREVHVEPLTRDQCMEFAAIRTGGERELIRQQVDELFENTGGNPYFLEQLIAGFDAATGTFCHVPLDDIIAGRLRRLPAAATELLDVIAVSSQPISVDEASKVISGTTSELATVTHMRSERLVRLIGGRDQPMVDAYHDKVREAVLAGMSDTRRRQLHRQLAETIEANEGLAADEALQALSACSTPGEYDEEVSPRIVDLAHHFSEAGDPRAFVYQLLAGEQALNTYAAEDAIVAYRKAERQLPSDASPALRYRLWFAMGRVLLWNKEVDTAADRAQRAVDMAGKKLDRARAYAGLGNVHRQVARFDQAVKQYDAALEQLGTRRPRTSIGKLFSFLAKSFRVLVVPVSWQRARNVRDSRAASIKYEILRSMFHCVLDKDFLATIDVNTHAAVAAFQTGEPRLLAIGHAQASQGYSGMGLHWIGNICLKRSSRLEAQLHDPALRGLLLLTQAQGCYWGGEPGKGQRLYEKAAPLLARGGDFYDVLISMHMIRHCRAYLGSAGSELQAAKSVIDLSTEVSHAQCICWGNYDAASALARRGVLDEAVKYVQQANAALSGERYYTTEAIRGSTDAYVRLQLSCYRMARELSVNAWHLASQSLMLIDATLLCLPVLVESVAGPDWRSALPAADARYVKKIIRRASLLYPTIPNHRPHLQRVFGRAYYAMGYHRKAIRNFENAIRISEQKGMDYQRAKSLLDLAAVTEDGRKENRVEAIELLKRMESVIPRAESWLLGDQYDEAVVAPEFDLKAWEQASEEGGEQHH